ncbi:MAG TPA: STAS domain-containing protein [Spirochaetota bacterium]
MEIKESESTIRINLSGSVDITDIGEFSGAVKSLCRETGKNIEVDLGQVNYLDSTGVSLLLKLYKHQKQQGKTFDIISASERAQGIINLCSLAETLHIR